MAPRGKKNRQASRVQEDVVDDWPGYEAGVIGVDSQHNFTVTQSLLMLGLLRRSSRRWSAEADRALLSFKQENGIKEGGVGPETWRALKLAVPSGEEQTTQTDPTPDPVVDPDVTPVGDPGPDEVAAPAPDLPEAPEPLTESPYDDAAVAVGDDQSS